MTRISHAWDEIDLGLGPVIRAGLRRLSRAAKIIAEQICATPGDWVNGE
jgi:hypothetical protein